MIAILKSIAARPLAVVAVAAAIPLVLAVASMQSSRAAEEAVAIPAPAVDTMAPGDGLEVAVIAGGCFWGVQGVFQHTEGVESAVSGYAGGTLANPTYEQVSSGTTGHAEVVQVTFDPKKISYGKLLQIFFSVAHNPTQLNFQGPDRGTQYRSAIFTTSDEQAKVAAAYIAQLDAAEAYPAPIVTEVKPLDTFFAAEDYHQDYATLNPDQPYIAYNDLPKIESLRTMFPDVWREKPVLVFAANGA